MAFDDRTPFVSVDPDRAQSLRLDCYVRSGVPAALADTIDAIVTRLRRLRERGRIDEVRIRQWPPHTDGVADSQATRADLLAEFERWAGRNGVSLEPAFRREVIPSSPLGVGSNERRERVRLPLLGLALSDNEEETLREVVPHTVPSDPGTGRTCTVDDWLDAVESMDRGASTSPVPGNRASRLERRQ